MTKSNRIRIYNNTAVYELYIRTMCLHIPTWRRELTYYNIGNNVYGETIIYLRTLPKRGDNARRFKDDRTHIMCSRTQGVHKMACRTVQKKK